MHRGTTRFTLFPYTTLFRSRRRDALAEGSRRQSLLRRLVAYPLVQLGERHHPAVERQDLVHAQIEPLDVVRQAQDRKSTRLNSSHQIISYAVFCLNKNILKR